MERSLCEDIHLIKFWQDIKTLPENDVFLLLTVKIEESMKFI